MNGKILVIFLLVLNLFALTANVDKQNVIQGDNVVFSITATGKDVEFPNITDIAGDNIEAVSTSQNISIINGNYQKTLTKTYAFTPSHSLTIPSFEVKVDGKIEKTKPIQIKVVKDTKLNKDFKLKIISDKNAIFGYPHLVKIKFYQKTNVKIGSVSLELPQGDFSLKQIGKEKHYFEGVYQIAEINYLLIPNKEEKIDFRVRLKLGFATQQIDNFGFIMSGMRYKTITSSTQIDVKKVYDGIIGDFNISLNVDKTKIQAGKPLNGKLIIKGYGDLNNLGEIKINVPNTTIYDNKAKIQTKIIGDKIYSKYEKSFVILADKNYTIPPLSFSFYDIKTKKVKNILTKQIDVEVIGSPKIPVVSTQNQKCNCPKIESKIVTKTIDKINYLYLIGVFLLGGIIGYLLSFIKFKEKFELPKNLYNKLLPYADNPEIKNILNKLYNKEKLTKQDKEFLKMFLKQI